MNNIDLPEGRYCKNMINNALEFDEYMYDIPPEELERYVADNSTNDFVYVEYGWQQLGHDTDWYSKQCRALEGNKMKIKRELDLAWPLSADKSPFNEEQLEMLNGYKKEYTGKIALLGGRYHLRVSNIIDPMKPYLLGCDCSGGGGSDNSTIVVVDPDTMEAVALFKSNKVDTVVFTDIITEILTKVLLNSVAIIERNSMGIAIIHNLLHNFKTAHRLFYWFKPEDTNRRKPIYGVNTTGSSRDIYIDKLFQLVAETPQCFSLPEILAEIRTLERKNNGKIEHAYGEHDDCLLAYLFTHYALSFSSINHFLNRRSVKTHTSNDELIVVKPILSVDNYLSDSSSRKKSINKVFDLNRNMTI